MRFTADESVDGQIVARLREDGHEIDYVAEMERSISDDQVLDQANEGGAILMTADKDFGELVFRTRRVTAGVVLVRMGGLTPAFKAKIVSEAIRRYSGELGDAFTVVTPGQVRIRGRIP